MDERGQAFAVFKLLIGAILAMMILIIILGAISYLDQLKIDISKERFYAALIDATNQPNGQILIVSDIYFDNTSYSRSALGAKMGIDGDCLELDSIENEIFVLHSESVEITRRHLTDVYMVCEPVDDSDFGSYPDECGFGCFISFAKEID
ncbi:MAG: hypothetical protein ABID38_04635 [Candidatus Diapherotrites archaeon]